MMTSNRTKTASFFTALVLTLGLFLPTMQVNAAGVISLPALGSAYTQNFNSLAFSGTSSTVPLGWDFYETRANANTIYTAGSGSINIGDTYSFGSTGSSERAFGGLQSFTLLPTVGAQFVNNTGTTITSLAISYTGEEWRLGTAGRTDVLRFQLSTDATSLATGTWAGYCNLNFTTPNTTGTGSKDGNNVTNRTQISFTITRLNIPNGTTFWIRWTDDNVTGGDDGLAIDDFSLTPLADVAGPISLSTLGSTYTQDFNTLAACSDTSSALPIGWDFHETRSRANTIYTAGSGSSNFGDTYSFGSTGLSDRAFGGLQSGTLLSTIGAQFVNNTGTTITSLAISYTGEEWRLGTSGRTDVLHFQLSTDATSLVTGAWTPYASLDFITPNTTSTGSKDGNNAANRTPISTSIIGINIPDGSIFWIRWTDEDVAGGDDGLAIDDFALTPDRAPFVSSSVRTDPDPTNAANVDFTVTFSKPVTGVDASDFTLTTTGIIGAAVTGVSGSGTTYTVTTNTGTGSGTLRLDVIDDDSVIDAVLNPLGGPGLGNGDFTTGEMYTIDKTAPLVSSSVRADPDPTNAANVDFTVTFSKPVTGVDASDFTLTTTGIIGAAVTGVSGSGTTYTVTTNTGTGTGTLRLDVIDDDSVIDAVLNPLGGPGLGNGDFSTGEMYTIDKTAPLVSSSVRADPDPTNAANVDFTVTFSKPVTSVDASDFTLTTTGIIGTAVTGVSGSGTTYTVTTNTGTGSGTLRLDVIDDDSVIDAVLNPLGGPGLGNGNFTTGEMYNIDKTGPVVVFGVNTVPSNNAVLTTGPTQITVEFSSDVKNDASAGAANNTTNYLLMEDGANGALDTVSCVGGLTADDTPITINSAVYNNGGAGPFVIMLTLNGSVPLPPGTYRLLICGTTSIEDLLGNELNDGTSDAQLNFTVGGTAALPSTGFAPGHVTLLPDQPSHTAYATMSGLWLDIPKIGVRRMAIVGVPLTADGWDVTWLGNDAGWLQGTAFPTWAGNSAITGHVWDAYNHPGPFANLNQLGWGDRVIITAGGVDFMYEVRSVQLVLPDSTALITRHEELSWLTLITCRSYDPDTGEYAQRLVVRAVLVDAR